ncbi:uncharacterized protein KGF55_002934 [Candida pseudojiufengensis]|uniref:uncharacterized protein n=1 Tax=Candida pseudojiufengensis TaxID=497109 RepID=UPI00222584A6|nr:uncharacterized protein KGF55_002934 [Candida pseudojiufengensis]KAI5963142.1 hypothetical protein KGF55_002934 [Candida pseudojiufengensis]
MNHLRLDLFLKLPDEVLVLIIKYINDNSKIETLISIPILQKYALPARYSKYQLDQFMHIPSDGTIKHLKELYETYNFKPSRIIIKASKMHELLISEEAPTDSQKELVFGFEKMNQYRNAEFEILVSDRMDVKLESILKEVNVAGVHYSEGSSYNLNAESVSKKVQIYFQAIQFSNIQIMSAIYESNYHVKFPTSLKKLTIDALCQKHFDTNLNDLKCLEYFDCQHISGVESLEALQLSKTIKSIKLSFCDFKTLGTLKNYNFLRCLVIHYCHSLFDVIKIVFPQSLETLVMDYFHVKNKITELFDSVKQGINKEFELSDFSSDGQSLIFGPKFRPPSNAKILIINGKSNTHMFELGTKLCLSAVHTLVLCGIKNIDLNMLFDSSLENMKKLEIRCCEISTVDKRLKYPNIQQFYFSSNTLSNLFQINLKQWINLNYFEIEWNTLVPLLSNDKEELLDPSWFLLNEVEVSKGISEYTNEKRKACAVIRTLRIDLSSITHLKLTNFDGFLFVHYSNYYPNNLPSEIDIKGCTTLRVLTLSGLSIQVLDLNNFPCSLQKVKIMNLELLQIRGKFSRLEQLMYLNLVDNKITYSMLVTQKFPSNLETLDLSENKIEDLTCLELHNCTKLKSLVMEEVTESEKPNGANEVKEFLRSLGIEQINYAIVTTYKFKILFRIKDGKEDFV